MKLHKIFLSAIAVISVILIFRNYQDVIASDKPINHGTEKNTEVIISPNYDITETKVTDRGRVLISNHTIVADNGFPLRGEHIRVAEFSDPDVDHDRTWREIAQDPNTWLRLTKDYNLNTVRLLLYRPPQNWPGGSCDNPPGRCYDTVYDALPYIDEMVEMASQLGMYLIIDYHPVGGHEEEDAKAWWDVLAPRYKDRTHVIYEITNEPGGSGVPTAAYEERMRARIRALAPDTMLILWSMENAFTDTIDGLLANTASYINADWQKTIIGLHMYWGYEWSDIQRLRNAYPMLNTEIGVPGDDNYLGILSGLEDIGTSWILLDAVYNDPDISVTWPKDPKTLTSLTDVPVQSVTINDVNACPIDLACGFSATVDPSAATIPISYTWQASGQSGAVHQTTSTTDYFQATWTLTGTQQVTVTAQNAFDDATTSHTFEVKTFDQVVYLPLILKHY